MTVRPNSLLVVFLAVAALGAAPASAAVSTEVSGGTIAITGDGGDDVVRVDLSDAHPTAGGAISVDGGGGEDTILFTGAETSEVVTIAPLGAVHSPFRLTRNVDNVVVDATGIEHLELRLGGGTDIVTSSEHLRAGTGLETMHATALGSARDGVDDHLQGSDTDDVIEAGPGDDVLLGRGGGDALHGGAHDDELDGGTGVDQLQGDPGMDLVRCGGDLDAIVSDPVDLVRDDCVLAVRNVP